MQTQGWNDECMLYLRGLCWREVRTEWHSLPKCRAENWGWAIQHLTWVWALLASSSVFFESIPPNSPSKGLGWGYSPSSGSGHVTQTGQLDHSNPLAPVIGSRASSCPKSKPVRLNCELFGNYWERITSLLLMLLSWDEVHLELPKAVSVPPGESLMEIKPRWVEREPGDEQKPGSSHAWNLPPDSFFFTLKTIVVKYI